MFFFAEKVFIDPLIPQPLVYFPHMCSMNTEAMNIKLMTRTGTGPLKLQRHQVSFIGLISSSKSSFL